MAAELSLAMPLRDGRSLMLQLHRRQWVVADLFDGGALAAAGITTGSQQGVLEHNCFCAIDPDQREAYLDTARRLLAPGGWLLGLFWCHRRPGSARSSRSRRRDQPPSATTSGWDYGDGDHLSKKTFITAAAGIARMSLTNDGPSYGSRVHGSLAARSDDESSNAKITDHH